MATAPERDLEKDVEAIRADIAALTDTVGKLAAEAVKAQAAFGKSAKAAAKGAARVGEEMWDETKQLGADASDAANDAVQAGVASLESQIKRNPVNAVLVALGIGFIVGLIGRK